MTVQLPSDVEKIIADQLKSGEYASAQDVVCAGLRLLKKQTIPDAPDDFQPGEWDRLLKEAEGSATMTLDEVIAKRRSERGSARAEISAQDK